MAFSRFLLLQFSTAHVELHALQARFIPTHYVHFDAHVDAVAHLNDTECGLEKLNQYYLVNFSRKINNARKGSFRGLIVLNGFSFL